MAGGGCVDVWPAAAADRCEPNRELCVRCGCVVTVWTCGGGERTQSLREEDEKKARGERSVYSTIQELKCQM